MSVLLHSACDFVNDSISLRVLEERVHLMDCVCLLLQAQRVSVHDWVVIIRINYVELMMDFGRVLGSWGSGRKTDVMW